MEFDSVRAIDSSARWRVLRLIPNSDYVEVRQVGVRLGVPPDGYNMLRRKKGITDRFSGWKLEPVENGPIKGVHIETLLRQADYVPAGGGKQKGLFV